MIWICTRIAVTALRRIIRKHAARARIAAVIRAHIIIVTHKRRTSNALPLTADVIGRALIAVITWIRVIRVSAHSIRTTVIGARITVITVCSARALRTSRNQRPVAHSVSAHIIRRTLIRVIALLRIICKHTSACWITAVIRTDITVTANSCPSGLALPILTLISRRARIAVIALRCIIRKHTSACRVTAVIRTQVPVITI